jgi:glycosyltransferase involved in cell wall biosynthesis
LAREALASVNHDLTTQPTDPVAVAIGRFVPAAGLAHLVKSWKGIASRFPTARLWIIGDGPERDRLYQLIGDLDLRQRIFLPGTFSDNRELLEAADLFVQPATADGPTLVLTEALAMGLAAIASDLPGHRSWIEPGRTGQLVPPGNSQALAAALNDLLQHPSRAITLGSAARQKIRESHSLEACAQQYLQLLGP